MLHLNFCLFNVVDLVKAVKSIFSRFNFFNFSRVKICVIPIIQLLIGLMNHNVISKCMHELPPIQLLFIKAAVYLNHFILNILAHEIGFAHSLPVGPFLESSASFSFIKV